MGRSIAFSLFTSLQLVNLFSLVRLIATATHEQTAVSNEIAEHLQGVQRIAEDNDEHAHGLQENSNMLLDTAQRLTELTDRIQVT